MAAVSSQASAVDPPEQPQLFGHPTGLFTLFFAEMWERCSYYGMRALLTLYMIKGFLGYTDKHSAVVYGAYTSLVYMMPYFGGMLADRLLGTRRAVVLGGLFMAAGHLLMTVQQPLTFFAALALIIVGNGFFKPNISTTVGTLYPKASDKKDGGFTIFYMGVNLGGFLAPIMCGYVGETYGWHYGFGIATAGMLVGLAVFVAPTRLTQALIGLGAVGTVVSLVKLQDSKLQLAVNMILAALLVAAAAASIAALQKGGLPAWAGAPPDAAKLGKRLRGPLRADVAVYLGALVVVPLIAFALQHDEVTRWTLIVVGNVAVAYYLVVGFRGSRIELQRIVVMLVMFAFSVVFWGFFEQAGSSINNYTDRNTDRVLETRRVDAGEVGKEITFRIAPKPAQGDAALAKLPLLSQEQLGMPIAPALVQRIAQLVHDDLPAKNAKIEDPAKRATPARIDEATATLSSWGVFTMDGLRVLRDRAGADDAKAEDKLVAWTVLPGDVGMGIADSEIPASEYQSVNSLFVLLFAVPFSALWVLLSRRKREPSTPVKFGLGLVLLGLGFVALWLGASRATGRGMVGMEWLILLYALHTMGELCLSPVGLSMVTKLAPSRIVAAAMGGWFLATALGQYAAGQISKLTGVAETGGIQVIPPPSQTLPLFTGVWGWLAVISGAAGVVLFVLAPTLSKWMHAGAEADAASPPRAEPPRGDADVDTPPVDAQAAS